MSLDALFAEAARLGWWIVLDYSPGERPATMVDVWTGEAGRPERAYVAEGDDPAATLAAAMRSAGWEEAGR